MEINELIRKRMCEYEPLSSLLTTFAKQPAIFSPTPPDDQAKGWKNKVHYPRIVFNYDLQASPERNTDGTLSIILLCQNTSDVFPEMIEPEVKRSLKDILINPDDGSLYTFAWERTDSFEIQDNSPQLVIGCEMRFDIIEYTGQETTDPDPIVGLNAYLKDVYPESIVVGYDRLEDITVTTKERPVIYCRLISLSNLETTYTVANMECRIAVHFLCPHSETRMRLTTAIAERLSKDAEYKLMDGSPLRLTRLQVEYRSDYLKEGQVIITGRFGILRYREKVHKVTSVKNTYHFDKEVFINGRR